MLVPNFTFPTSYPSRSRTPLPSPIPRLLQALLLLARMLLLPLPLRHAVWVQAAEVRAGLANLARQPATAACCSFVSAARRALDTLAGHGAPLRPTPLGPPPTAAQCCWMAPSFALLLVGAVLPAVVATARAQRAAAWAAWVQAAWLRGRRIKSGSPDGTGSSPGTRSSPKSSPENGTGSSPANSTASSPESLQWSSPGSSASHRTSPSLSRSASASSESFLPEGSPLDSPEGSESASPAASESGSDIDTASLDPPDPTSSGGSGPAAVEGQPPCDPASADCGNCKAVAAAGRRRRSSPASLPGTEDCSAGEGSSPPHSDAPVPLAALPAALLSAPLPLTWVQCVFLLLPASAALWAALEVAINVQAA